MRTFDDFSRESSDRWAEHETIKQKPPSEFLGPGLDTISFTMRFDVRFGMNPRVEMEKLLIMSRNGQVETLIIGGKGLGVYKWYITSLKQKWQIVDNRGNVLIGVLDVTLKEYV
jgi:phage protein U